MSKEITITEEKFIQYGVECANEAIDVNTKINEKLIEQILKSLLEEILKHEREVYAQGDKKFVSVSDIRKAFDKLNVKG